jgi:hypothetical protein
MDRDQKSRHVFLGKLRTQSCTKFIDTEFTKVFVEIAKRWRERDRLDPGRLRPLG